jgi:hypothetical protein
VERTVRPVSFMASYTKAVQKRKSVSRRQAAPTFTAHTIGSQTFARYMWSDVKFDYQRRICTVGIFCGYLSPSNEWLRTCTDVSSSPPKRTKVYPTDKVLELINLVMRIMIGGCENRTWRSTW